MLTALIVSLITIPLVGFICFWIGRLTAPSGGGGFGNGGGSEI